MGQPFGSGYELDQRMRSGTLGELWRAHDLNGRACAVTILDHDLGARVGSELSHRFWAVRSRWLRAGGPRVIVVRDIVIDGPRRGLVTDWIDGQPLDDALDQYGAMPPDDLRQVGAEIADALATVHDAGLTHGNLTTGNVIVDFSGDRPVPRLTGLSDAALLGVHDANFAAPEVDQAPTGASDLYALGMVLRSMSEGRPPRPGGTDPTSQRPDSVPNAVWQLIGRLTEHDPSRRGTARAAAETLRTGSLGSVDDSAMTVVLPRPTVTEVIDAPDASAEPTQVLPSIDSGIATSGQAAPDHDAPAPSSPPETHGHEDGPTDTDLAALMPRRRRVVIPWLLLLLLPAIAYGAYLGFQQLLRPVSDQAVPLPRPSSSARPTPSATSAPATKPSPAKPPAPPTTKPPAPPTTKPPAPSATPSTPLPPSFPNGVASCGTEVGVNANTTSCEFAAVVNQLARPVMAGGQRTFTVSATSPTTKQTYAMSCRPSGAFVMCTGGNQAAVYLRV